MCSMKLGTRGPNSATRNGTRRSKKLSCRGDCGTVKLGCYFHTHDFEQHANAPTVIEMRKATNASTTPGGTGVGCSAPMINEATPNVPLMLGVRSCANESLGEGRPRGHHPSGSGPLPRARSTSMAKG